MSEEQLEKNPDLDLAQLRFQLSLPDDLVKDKAGIKHKLLEAIKEKKMLPFYLSLVEQFKWQPDNALVDTLRNSNEEELKLLMIKLKTQKRI